VHEEDGKPFELEMSWLCEESGWKHARVRLSPIFSTHFTGRVDVALLLYVVARQPFCSSCLCTVCRHVITSSSLVCCAVPCGTD
jgi:hypothetical protein